jgi:hypothetical protein
MWFFGLPLSRQYPAVIFSGIFNSCAGNIYFNEDGMQLFYTFEPLNQ